VEPLGPASHWLLDGRLGESRTHSVKGDSRGSWESLAAQTLSSWAMDIPPTEGTWAEGHLGTM
jgi:hypothetical protein